MDEKNNKAQGLGGQIASQPKYKEAPKLPANLSQATKTEGRKEKFEKLKIKLEQLKKKILKKYKFTRTIGVLPANAASMVEEEEGIPKEISDTKPVHLIMIIPEDEYKNIPKIKPEIIKLIQDTKENLWVHLKTEVDLWNYGLDSKYGMIDAISASFPLYDSGFLGALRVANIHKSLVLRKFEKYVASYVIGGSLVRGTADETSDVDTFVIIDDTDVKRMPRLELLEKLRGIIYDYIREATALAGVKNVLNVQVYLMTDFWQSVKDAHPVMFTFIRDGIPMHDRGTFIPWKLLLKMGKIKPSPEAIDAYMKQGEQTERFIKRRMIDAMIDAYWGIVTPTQAMMMLAGEAPPVPKTIVADVKKVLVDREKVLSLKDLKTLEKIVGLYKSYEHQKLKEIPGKEIDSLVKEALAYRKVLEEVRKKLEGRISQKTAEEIYEEVFKLLKSLLKGKTQDALIKSFETELVKKGKMQPRFMGILNDLVSIKRKLKSGKLSHREVEKAKGNAAELVDALVEYAQRADLAIVKKGTVRVVYGDKKAELVLLGKSNFLIEGKTIRRVAEKKLISSSKEELEKALAENKGKLSMSVSGDIFIALRKELGDFKIIL